ncbi:PREDICTED: myc-associated zinc finger protein-like [Priapulus caudatus]|uniref:Myc-associated zinc finger protein-like n=1 Tax=Priapulus caudatus TaxID=37621 RepID=A0ABM1F123_PRICU|nr:PREDICTED: myc-associated zinc finger protein-like [Priapulus caudatus]
MKGTKVTSTEDVCLVRCGLCDKMFTLLATLQSHLSSHIKKESAEDCSESGKQRGGARQRGASQDDGTTAAATAALVTAPHSPRPVSTAGVTTETHSPRPVSTAGVTTETHSTRPCVGRVKQEPVDLYEELVRCGAAKIAASIAAGNDEDEDEDDDGCRGDAYPVVVKLEGEREAVPSMLYVNAAGVAALHAGGGGGGTGGGGEGGKQALAGAVPNISISKVTGRFAPSSSTSASATKASSVRDLMQRSPEYVARRMCRVCGKISLKPSDLTRHMLVHTNERRFPCSLCDYRCKSRNSLELHLTNVHGVDFSNDPSRIYKCNFCARRFYRKSSLGYHITVTHGRSRALSRFCPFPYYRCATCSRQFRTVSALGHHTSVAHGSRGSQPSAERLPTTHVDYKPQQGAPASGAEPTVVATVSACRRGDTSSSTGGAAGEGVAVADKMAARPAATCKRQIEEVVERMRAQVALPAAAENAQVVPLGGRCGMPVAAEAAVAEEEVGRLAREFDVSIDGDDSGSLPAQKFRFNCVRRAPLRDLDEGHEWSRVAEDVCSVRALRPVRQDVHALLATLQSHLSCTSKIRGALPSESADSSERRRR